jgi:hypothetical protein
MGFAETGLQLIENSAWNSLFGNRKAWSRSVDGSGLETHYQPEVYNW